MKFAVSIHVETNAYSYMVQVHARSIKIHHNGGSSSLEETIKKNPSLSLELRVLYMSDFHATTRGFDLKGSVRNNSKVPSCKNQRHILIRGV